MTRVVQLPGGALVDVSGEVTHARALAALVGDRVGRDFSSVEVTALLVPDLDADRPCVRVVVDGRDVGYLDREALARFLPVAERILDLGCEAKCVAQVIGRRGMLGMVLELGDPDECIECLSARP